MDRKITPLIEAIIKNAMKMDTAAKKIVHESKLELAERLILGLWPGPTADVHVVSNPEGTSSNIKFNTMR